MQPERSLRLVCALSDLCVSASSVFPLARLNLLNNRYRPHSSAIVESVTRNGNRGISRLEPVIAVTLAFLWRYNSKRDREIIVR